jgi:hypothetical protein
LRLLLYTALATLFISVGTKFSSVIDWSSVLIILDGLDDLSSVALSFGVNSEYMSLHFSVVCFTII